MCQSFLNTASWKQNFFNKSKHFCCFMHRNIYMSQIGEFSLLNDNLLAVRFRILKIVPEKHRKYYRERMMLWEVCHSNSREYSRDLFAFLLVYLLQRLVLHFSSSPLKMLKITKINRMTMVLLSWQLRWDEL